MSYENCFEEMYDSEGFYDFPTIKPVYDIKVDTWRLFEEIRNSNCTDFINGVDTRPNKGVVFFQDDHKFESVWTQPRKHLDKLKGYGAVLSPDFSMFTDFPKAVQIMQMYKRHWVARFWQEHGVTVIPTICWSTPDNYDWCFDAEPHNSIVAVSDIGCTRNPVAKELFDSGYKEMLKRLNPSKILFFTYWTDKVYEGNVQFIDLKKQKNFIH